MKTEIWDLNIGDDGATISIRDTGTMATISPDFTDWQNTARLLFAAPDNLAANVLALSAMRQAARFVESAPGTFDAAIAACEAAIAKAGGDPGAAPAPSPLRQFCAMVANFEPIEFDEGESWTDDQAEDAIVTVNRLIEEARKVLS